MGKTEEQIYNELMQSSPGNAVSAQAKASAAALANAEAAAANTEYVPGGADRELDKAINEYLSGRGFEYSTENDKDYQAFRQQYRKFADKGRKQGIENTNTLANGYTPTYADTVGDQIYSDQMNGVRYYEPAFRQLAQQEQGLKDAQAANAVSILGQQAQTEYGRQRDAVSDNKNYMNYLAQMAALEKENDSKLSGMDTDTYITRLANAQDALDDARKSGNNRYLYGTQSADSAAKIAQSDRENERKIQYYKDKDEYDERVKREAEEAAAREAEEAARERENQAAAKGQLQASAAQDKAAASEAQAAAKEQETAKYASWLLQKYFAGDDSIKLSTKDRYNYDYNGDGDITNADMVIAGKIARGEGRAADFKNLSIVPGMTKDTNDIIKKVRQAQKEVPNGDGRNRQKKLEQVTRNRIEALSTNDEERAYLYEYFNLA